MKTCQNTLLRVVGAVLLGSVTAVRVEESDPGFCGGDGRIQQSSVYNFSGVGTFDTLNFNGASMEWNIDGSAGNYTFTWLYDFGAAEPSDRFGTLSIDGIEFGEVSFPNTTVSGGDPVYTEATFTVQGLHSGKKKVMLSAGTDAGLPGIDWFEATGVDDISSPSCCASQLEGDVNDLLQGLGLDVPLVQEVDGWASVWGVTGGGSVLPTVVTTLGELRNAVRGNCSKVVVVQGSIATGSNVSLGSNTTLIGAGSDAKLTDGKLEIRDIENVIVQNIEFANSDDDLVELRFATGVVVTQCSFHDSSDELLSVIRGSDYVTFSYNHFYFLAVTEHAYGNLIGHSDSNGDQDRGHLKVTLHDNFYGIGVEQRQPRVRFGQVHVYNTYFQSNYTDSMIGLGFEAQIRVENIYVENQEDVFEDNGGVEDAGQLGWRNVFNDSSEIIAIVENTFPVFDVPYEYSLKEDSLLNIVMPACAGVGKFDTEACVQATAASAIVASPAGYPQQSMLGFFSCYLAGVWNIR